MLPNFLIISPGKSGTNALYHYLEQHPEIYMCPVKEPRFFALEGREPDSFQGPGDREMISQTAVTTLDDYQALFAGVSGEKAIGEATVTYLHVPEAAARIKHYVPQAKLVAVLRNPVERAYLAYLRKVLTGRETLGFSEALEEEERRIHNNWAPGWQYKRIGFYHAHLTRYYELFEPEQIQIYLYEDLEEDPLGTTQSIFSFLEVEDSFVPDTSASYDDNLSVVPRSHAFNTFVGKPNALKAALRPFLPQRLRRGILAKLHERNLKGAPPMDEGIREELTEAYREDILKLEGLIGRDLSGWLGQEAS
jgi:Sulfotransferase family